MNKLLWLVLLLIPLSVQAEYETGHDMLEVCSAVKSESTKKSKSSKHKDELATTACSKYLAGVSDFNEAAGMPYNRNGLFFCPTAGVTLKDLTAIYVRYLQAHPEFLEANATLLALNAFKEEFPCDYKNLLNRQ